MPHTQDLCELEIAAIPPLSMAERALLDMHSVVNVVNVVHSDLLMLGLLLAEDEGLLHTGVAACEMLVGLLGDPERVPEAVAGIEALAAAVLAEVDAAMAATGGAPDSDAGALRSSLATVFAVLDVRLRELQIRLQEPPTWHPCDADRLRSNLRAVLAAIEKHSHGRYHIQFNAARQGPSDYYFDLRIEAHDRRLWLPPVFEDVLRDLLANARKYTAPGGHITAAVYADGDSARIVVADDGRGIPEAELAEVVAFGKRGSNAADVRTMGGGFGLTKAFMATQQFGGRFWIGSRPGKGTRVRIWLPRPAEAR